MSDNLLSQDEINALLNGEDDLLDDASSGLTDDEKDAIGEIGNISMGTSATTLSTLLNEKVVITTPRVEEKKISDLSSDYEEPYVIINIKYKKGIEGSNILLLKENDVKIITDLMMGGDGSNIADEITDLHLSAIGEAMNQMIGSSATSLSEMLGKSIDIMPPEANHHKIDEIDTDFLSVENEDQLAIISFEMKVGELIDSKIMQIMPIDLVKELVEKLMSGTAEEQVDDEAPVVEEEQVQPQPQPEPQQQQQVQPQMQTQAQPQQQAQPQMQAQQQRPQVNAQPLQFQSFDNNQNVGSFSGDIGLIEDVPLEISVELGKTKRKISEILDFGPGTVIELERLIGDPLDILANGKPIAKGEVVVVDENYGIRITEIVLPKDRLKK